MRERQDRHDRLSRVQDPAAAPVQLWRRAVASSRGTRGRRYGVRHANRHSVPGSNHYGNGVGHTDTMPIGLSNRNRNRNRNRISDGDAHCLAYRMSNAHRDIHALPDAYAYCDSDTHTNGSGLSDSDRYTHGISDRVTLPVRACDTGSPAGRAVLQRALVSSGAGLSRSLRLAAHTATPWTSRTQPASRQRSPSHSGRP
jgi:hypothetical protein